MLRKAAVIGVFVLALAPSAYLAWTLRTMPHLGFYHDDSIYWVSAKSLAKGTATGSPASRANPIRPNIRRFYSALLAGIWKLNPNFPSNLPAATLFAWLLLPVYLAMLWMFLRQYGFGRASAVCASASGRAESGRGRLQLLVDAGVVVYRIAARKPAAG